MTTILFDLDGTLLDTAPDFWFVVNQLRHARSLSPLTLDQIKPAVAKGLTALATLVMENTDTNIDAACELEASEQLKQELLKLYSENLTRHTLPFPGILQCLDDLEKYKISWGIVTNKRGFLTEPLLQKLNLFHRAACVVSGDTTPHPKPSPDPLLYACKQLKIDPSTCIYVGDAEQDVQAGKAATMNTVTALFGYIPSLQVALSWGADLSVSHPSEILPYVLSKVKTV